MGWIVVVLQKLMVWLDRLSERPVSTVVPDLEELLLNPQQTLAGRQIVIGPGTRLGSPIVLVTTLGLLVWYCTILRWGLLVALIQRGPNQMIAWAGLVVLPSLVLLGLACFAGYQARGGRMVLSERGVELHYRGTVVVCPWQLFNTPGQPVFPRRDLLILPVDPAAVPLVEAYRGGHLVAVGMDVDTKQLQLPSPAEALLLPLYRINALVLGKIVLHLGRVLGAATPNAARPQGLRRTELAEDVSGGNSDGWITIPLTRLVFPPRCCACGAPTRGRQKFSAHELSLDPGRLLHPTLSESVHVWVPVCYACQTANQRRVFHAVVYGFGIGLLLVSMSVGGARLWPGNLIIAYLVMFSLFLGPLLGGVIGYYLGRARSQPVQLRHYEPANGTVSIRFRRPGYAEQVLQAMHLDMTG
jgi:hypothetical protein